MSISLLRQAQHKNANSYNAGPEETVIQSVAENTKCLIIKMGCVTLFNLFGAKLGEIVGLFSI